MSDMKKLTIGSTQYNVVDETARTSISKLTNGLATKANSSDVYTKTEVNNLFSTTNIKKITRRTGTATTGSTGNIATGVNNDGTHFVTGGFISGRNYLVTAWVAYSTNSWYLTVRNAETLAPVANESVDFRYLEIELYNA